MIEFSTLLFKLLRQMDAEANTFSGTSPTGLNWYGGYREPTKKRPRTEPCWSQRLAELLSSAGYPTKAEVPYPLSPRTRCDCVITLPNGERLWLEIKGAWKNYWAKRGGNLIYRSYLLHPLAPGLDPKTHTVPLDLNKLTPLCPPHADHVGLLLIGFENDADPMDGDVAELVGLAGLNRPQWAAASDRWPDPYRSDLHIRCWLWHRPAVQAP